MADTVPFSASLPATGILLRWSSTTTSCLLTRSRRACILLISASEWGGSNPPYPVRTVARRSRNPGFPGCRPKIPCRNSKPRIRLFPLCLSLISASRSRPIRRWSSCSIVGTRTGERTSLSPDFQAFRARIIRMASIRSVLTFLARRSTSRLAGSMMTTSMSGACLSR